MNQSKYIVVGGCLLEAYTSRATYSGLRKIGEYSSYGEAEKAVSKYFNECGGLIGIFTLGDENSYRGSFDK